ncbi:hypothetical protein [Streptacidiphilus sp. ASG 303]|uniref:hypothetical protein n=1 Tax=Streptacidiphilus sp. ASG 303 TaxID=2896847 RepID=UPI0027E002A2|nr:hypothetical protein [Streptacidiphilus sp. ASG 303]
MGVLRTGAAAVAGLPGRSRRWWRGLSRPRRAAVALAVVLAVLAAPVAAAAAALRLEGAGEPRADARTRGRDALWLGHAWVDGRRGPADTAALAADLRTTGIRDLYVHAGPLGHDGTLDPRLYPRARRLVGELHRAAPGLRVHAWLGDVVAPEHPEGLHLDRPAVRAAVAASAGQVLDADFAGVHLDLEPVRSGDPGFLDVLDRTRAVTARRGAVLSAATPQIDPLPGLHRAAAALADHPKWWSQAYFGQVARRVDQVAVMSYDTGTPLESLYSGYVAQQTALALEAVPGRVDLLMGLPAYREEKFGHWGHAETVAAAVRGVRLGLGRTEPGRERFGVALYVDFTATPRDWSDYRAGWAVRRPAG